MSAQPIALSTRDTDQEFSFIEALSLAPKESLTLVSKEALGLPPSPRISTVTTTAPVNPDHLTPKPKAQATLAPPPLTTHSLSPVPTHTSAHSHPSAHSPISRPGSPHQMAASTKAQAHCVDLCCKATAVGDRASVRMLEYLTTVKHQPHGFDKMAHDFLDTCLTLFAIEAGLGEGVRTAQILPMDMIAELDKKFRVAQSTFTLLEQMVAKFIDYEKKGTMGRWKRGWGKIFGGDEIEKMTASLARVREGLKMSALMFQWSLGAERIESEMGIGYTGLAAALDRLDHRNGSHRGKHSDGHGSQYRPSSASQHRGHEGHGQGAIMEQAQPPLPPLPWNERASSYHETPIVASPPAEIRAVPSLDARPYPSSVPRRTASSTTSSTDRHHSNITATFDRLSTFDEHRENVSQTDSDSDALLEDLAGVDMTATKIVRVKADPTAMARWQPRNTAGAEAPNLKSGLISAVRGKNHKLIEQLLDRGVSPNTGPEFHALVEAATFGDDESMRLLLAFGADPNEPDREGISPLFVAVDKGLLAIAALLLKYGADPNRAADEELNSPLGLAVATNKTNMTHLLLMYGGDINHLTADGDTLLITAINKKTPRKFIDLLLDYGALPNDKSSEGKTALFEAISKGRVDIVTTLLEHGGDANMPGPKHLLWPAASSPGCLQVLLSHGADSKKAPGVMELATSVNKIESVRVLLKAGVDPNTKKDGVYTPLCSAIRDNRPEIFNLLLSHGADPNEPASEYPTFKCITHKRLQFLPALVAAGANLTQPKGILECAVSLKDAKAVAWLLDQGLSANERNARGHTPLTAAIKLNLPDMVDLLLARGADPNMRGEDWPVCMAVRNPPILKRLLAVLAEPRAFKGVLERAVAAGQMESARLLLAAGVSVEDKNGGVFSPLTTAIRENHADIVVYLLDEAGADINAPGEHLPIVKALRRFAGEDTAMLELLLARGADANKLYRGWNGVMQAVENGDEHVLKLLADRAGVDLEVRNDEGRTVTEIAASRGWDEAVAILQQGAKR